MIQKVARRLATLPTAVPGYLPTLRRLKARSFAVVMYHGVLAEEQAWSSWSQLPISDFAAQIDLLADHYKLLPLDEVIDRVRAGRPLPESSACVTFDDGFRNVATAAFPLLEHRQVPATVFLVTSLVGTDQPPWPTRLFHAILSSPCESVHLDGADYALTTLQQRESSYSKLSSRLKRMDQNQREDRLADLGEKLGWPQVPRESPLAVMGWDEVEQMAATKLIQFGSHSHTHPILSRCGADVQRRELELSRDILRERGLSWRLFAYPNGTVADFTAETKALLHELDYHCGLATIPGLNNGACDLFEVRRVEVGADTTLQQFELGMVGL
jgi:peptidoglycan/xylan/chitin deacetylase (PgdA/CDA1 family)